VVLPLLLLIRLLDQITEEFLQMEELQESGINHHGVNHLVLLQFRLLPIKLDGGQVKDNIIKATFRLHI
jgi:hypothetical protein